MKIITDRQILSKKSQETSPSEIQGMDLVMRSKDALLTAWTPGIGVAAIQLGVPVRFAWYQYQKQDPVLLINPEIVEVENLVAFRNEGCLSMPDYRVNTWRFERVTFTNMVEGENRISERRKFIVEGFEAFVVQHEIDHMNGILCDERRAKPEMPGRNEPCICGSKLKLKRCCLEKGEDFVLAKLARVI